MSALPTWTLPKADRKAESWLGRCLVAADRLESAGISFSGDEYRDEDTLKIFRERCNEGRRFKSGPGYFIRLIDIGRKATASDP